MNELSTNQSQIQKTDVGYKIKVDSRLHKLSRAITPTMLLVSTVILFISTMLSEVLAQILFLILFAQTFIYFSKYLLVSEITIDKSYIQQGNKTIQLRNIPYLDFYIKMVSDGVQVRMYQIEFKLNDAADIPLLTDILEQTANISFYDTHQLSDNSEVLTFKAKHIVKPIFSTFLTIEDKPSIIRFYDMTSAFSWFEIKKNQANRIRYSKPKGDEFVTGSIKLNEIKKLQVIIDNRANVTKRFRRVSLLAIEKGASQNSIIKAYNNYFTPTHHSYIFQSNLRNAKDELTNMRDGEKMYDLLKNLPSLANIEIEKVIVNP